MYVLAVGVRVMIEHTSELTTLVVATEAKHKLPVSCRAPSEGVHDHPLPTVAPINVEVTGVVQLPAASNPPPMDTVVVTKNPLTDVPLTVKLVMVVVARVEVPETVSAALIVRNWLRGESAIMP